MAWFGANKSKAADYGVMTPKRMVAYKTLMTMQNLKPEDIVKGAEAFEQSGLPEYGRMLRKRAALKTAPQDVRQKRQEILRSLFKSEDPDEVEEGAKAFDQIGATIAAMRLRDYAKGLRAKQSTRG